MMNITNATLNELTSASVVMSLQSLDMISIAGFILRLFLLRFDRYSLRIICTVRLLVQSSICLPEHGMPNTLLISALLNFITLSLPKTKLLVKWFTLHISDTANLLSIWFEWGKCNIPSNPIYVTICLFLLSNLEIMSCTFLNEHLDATEHISTFL
jgi:hypothetical protein